MILNPILDLRAVYEAMVFAETAHRGRTRWDGSPEFNHLMSVAQRALWHVKDHEMYDPTDAVVVALLHDVVEDTDVTLAGVLDAFGYDIAEAVADLTQEPGESRDAYLNRCMTSKNPVVHLVKWADRCDNVSGLHTTPDLPLYKDHVATYFAELEKHFEPNQHLVPAELANDLTATTGRARAYFKQGKAVPFPGMEAA